MGYAQNLLLRNVRAVVDSLREAATQSEGPAGPAGAPGDDGVGVPAGGTIGQALVKASAADFDTTWSTISGAGGGGADLPAYDASNGGQVLSVHGPEETDSAVYPMWRTVAELPGFGSNGQVLTTLFSGGNPYVAYVTPHYPPTGGATNQVLTKNSATDWDFSWQTNVAILPTGGATGQFLVKSSNADYDGSWATVLQLPAGGATNALLAKNSATSGDAHWLTAPSADGQVLKYTAAGGIFWGAPANPVPAGGTTGQVLSKASNADYNLGWVSIPNDLPTGGTAGQFLVKNSGTNYDAVWTTPATLFPTRDTATVTTSAIVANGNWTGLITMAKGYRLMSMTVSQAARVRLYTRAAAQTADLTRAIGTDPAPSAGVMFDYSATSTAAQELSPLVHGWNNEAVPSTSIPITVTPTASAAGGMTVTFLYARTE